MPRPPKEAAPGTRASRKPANDTAPAVSLRTRAERLQAATDSATPTRILAKIISRASRDDVDLCDLLAQHPNVTGDLIRKLLDREPWSPRSIRIHWVNHPRATTADIAEFASEAVSGYDAPLALALLARPDLPDEALHLLLGSASPEVRTETVRRFPTSAAVQSILAVLGTGDIATFAALDGVLSSRTAKSLFELHLEGYLTLLAAHPDTPAKLFIDLLKLDSYRISKTIWTALAGRRALPKLFWTVAPLSAQRLAVRAGAPASRDLCWRLALSDELHWGNGADPLEASDEAWMPPDIWGAFTYLTGPEGASGRDPQGRLNRVLIDEILSRHEFFDIDYPFSSVEEALVIHPDFPREKLGELREFQSPKVTLARTPILDAALFETLLKRHGVDELKAAIQSSVYPVAPAILARLDREEERVRQREADQQASEIAYARAREAQRADIEKHGPFRWLDSWFMKESIFPTWEDGGPASATDPGAVGVFLEPGSAESFYGMYWFRDQREAAEALVLSMPLVFQRADDETLEDRLEAFRDAAVTPWGRKTPSDPWSTVNAYLFQDARCELIAVGTLDDFASSRVKGFASIRKRWRKGTDREGAGNPVPAGDMESFLEWCDESNMEGGSFSFEDE